MYLDPPVKGSEYVDAEGTEAVESEGRCRDAPRSNGSSTEWRMDIQSVVLPVKGSAYSLPPPKFTPPVFFSMNCATWSIYVSGRSFFSRKRWAAVNGFSVNICHLYDSNAGDKTKHTIGVVWKLERGDPILDVNVKDVVILLPIVKLLASRANSIDDLPDFLPLIARAVPLNESLVKFMP